MSLSAISTELKERVEDELGWDPQVTSGTIGVTSKDGVVTLTGFVPTYAERLAAERAALRVRGTRAVANDLVVEPVGHPIDPDVARQAADALRSNAVVPKSVQVTVRHGEVFLEGTCQWWFQRNAAEKGVRHLPGVRHVHNQIVIKPRVSPVMAGEKIEEALRRNAAIDANNIRVVATEGTVTLSGHVRSHAERVVAERAAWAAPGVFDVENNLEILP